MRPIAVFLLFGWSAFAQENQPVAPSATQDSAAVVTKPLVLPPISGVVESYVYDPETDMYVRQSGLSGYTFGAPLMLTPQQYWSMVDRQQSRIYLQDKIDAYAQTDQEKQKDKNLPTI